MKVLKDLLTDEKIIFGDPDKVVVGLSNNSKEIKKDYIFFAVKGYSTDGHNYIEDAIKNGSNVIFIEDESWINRLNKDNITLIKSENVRKSLSLISNRFYDNPSKDLKVIGITGTNGKTTTSNLLAQYYQLAGYNVGVIGTINYRVGDEVISAGHTTPDPVN